MARLIHALRKAFADLVARARGKPYVQGMKLNELQLEVERLSPDDQRKLIGFLVAMDIRRDDGYKNELSRRLEDQSPDGWISLQEAERRLTSDGV